MTEPTRLRVYDRNEWLDIVRRHWPDLEDAEFDRLWDGFCRMKEQGGNGHSRKSPS